MARYAIVRQDGEVDKVDGLSVDDVANRYGWPGNGNIEAWDDGAHNAKLRATFESPEQQREFIAALDKPRSKESKEVIAEFTDADDSKKGTN